VNIYQNVFSAGLRVIFDVERDEELSESAVDGLVHLVEDKVKQVEAGDEGRRKVDVAGDR
jgi:hypothetical protein